MSTIHFTTTEKFYDKIAKLAGAQNVEHTPEDKARMIERLDDAYNEIVSRLSNRGLSATSIATWARGEEYQLDIATYWYGRDNKWGRKNFEDVDWLKVFDRREELDNVVVVNTDGDVLLKGTGVVAQGIDLQDVNYNLGFEKYY